MNGNGASAEGSHHNSECKNCQDTHVNGLEGKLLKLNIQNSEPNNNHVSAPSRTLFDSEIFSKIPLDEFFNQYDKLELIKNDNNEYQFDLGDDLVLRSLRVDDFQRDYLKLLEQLTVVGDDVNKEKFESRFYAMKSCSNNYYILVVEDLSLSKIIASTTLVNEQKFIRHASSRGRIEDVVVDDKYRGKKLGKLLLDFAVALSKVAGCYKVSLECKDALKKFYGQFGFKLEDGQNYLCRRQ